jgi:hypothetical protein
MWNSAIVPDFPKLFEAFPARRWDARKDISDEMYGFSASRIVRSIPQTVSTSKPFEAF